MKMRYAMLFALCSFGASLHATQSINRTEDQEKSNLYYCPEKVVCTKFNDPGTCSYKTSEPRYWGELKYNGLVLQNTYKLDAVIASFHSPNVEPVSCVYAVDGNKHYQISLSAKVESNLSVFYKKPTNWVFANSENAYQGLCVSADKGAKACPLKEEAALIFYNANMGNGVTASIDKNYISSVSTSQYGKVNYESALNYCQGVRECRIGFDSSQVIYYVGQGFSYGEVTVDMYNNMKILKISAITPLADISQIGAYNAVEIGYSYQGKR